MTSITSWSADFNGDGKTDYMWSYDGWYIATTWFAGTYDEISSSVTMNTA
ncbi:MAG: hypothetical protein M0C28_17615 [Candidatus Moduliflexus flocculans]|nr:hypothetical protein [Candidatus Moduliflexus flocculans]